MRLVLPPLLLLMLACAAPAAANPTSHDPAKIPQGSYRLDPRHASLMARITHMGFSHYTLRFDGLSGDFSYDPAQWPTTKVTIDVRADSVDTGDTGFNKQIAGYFGAAQHPDIIFVSNAVTVDPDGHGALAGDLTLHGVTKPVTLDVTFNGVGPGLLGLGTRMGFSGVGHIRKSDFGITGGAPFVSDEVDLVFEVEFVRA